MVGSSIARFYNAPIMVWFVRGHKGSRNGACGGSPAAENTSEFNSLRLISRDRH
jgi:hypothetical protein